MPGRQLFTLTHWLLKVAAILAAIIAVALILSLGALLVIGTMLDADRLGIPLTVEGMARGEVLALAGFALLAGLLCVLLFLFVIVITTRIIESAIAGNPFVRENARRLECIGWLLLAAEMVGLLANLTLSHFVPEKLHIDLGFDVSPVGLLAALLIFVLAQIFRHGSEMRAELEGTV